MIQDVLRKVRLRIREESFRAYCLRILIGGVYFKALRKAVFSRRMRKTTCDLFGTIVFLSVRQEGITEELLLYRIHEPISTRLYLDLLEGTDVVLDIGSNIGYYSFVASARLKNPSHIHCFEPDPELAEILKLNRDSAKKCWVINQIAVSDIDGWIQFYRSEVSNWGSIRRVAENRVVDVIEVKSTTIDHYCRERQITPTFLRMDIEGGELAALRGAENVLLKRPKLFIEVHLAFLTTTERTELKNLLSDVGYTKCIAVKRYYDTPWAIKLKSHCIIEDGHIEKVFGLSGRDESVMSLFLC